MKKNYVPIYKQTSSIMAIPKNMNKTAYFGTAVKINITIRLNIPETPENI